MDQDNEKNETFVKKQFLKTKKTERNPAVLVTGGAGFVGSNLCKYLARKGYEVYAADNLITGTYVGIEEIKNKKNFHFYKMDVTSEEFFQTFSSLPIKQIFHLACPTGVPNIQKLSEEMLLTCSIGTRNVMEVAKKCNAKLLFSSSSEIYGQPEVFPQDETYHGNVNPVGFRSPYEEGKRFSESLIIMYARKYKVDVDIVRFFNVYGPGMSKEDTRVIPHIIKSILQKECPTIYGDGKQTRTFLYIDDLISGLLLIMEKGRIGEVYNIGCTQQVTINELAETIARIARWKKGIMYKPHFIEDHVRRQPSIRKIRNLGWKKNVTLEEGIKKTINFFKKEQPEK